MFGWTVYDADTGRILNSGHTNDIANVAIQSAASHEIVLGVELKREDFYVLDHEPVARPQLVAEPVATIIANGVDVFEITEVPEGTRFIFDGVSHIVDDGVFELTRSVPGVYSLRIVPPFPFKTQIVRIVANAV